MNIFLWILQVICSIMFVMAGMTKVAQTKEKLRTSAPWVDDFSAAQVRLIGLVELLGAMGLILPGVTGILPILTPIAALCLGALVVGAAYTHIRRKETGQLMLPVIMLLLSLLIALGRFWFSPF